MQKEDGDRAGGYVLMRRAAYGTPRGRDVRAESDRRSKGVAIMTDCADTIGISAKTPKGEVVLRAVRPRKGSFRTASALAFLRNSGSVDRALGAVFASIKGSADAVLPCVLLKDRGVREAGRMSALEMDGHRSVVADAMDCAVGDGTG